MTTFVKNYLTWDRKSIVLTKPHSFLVVLRLSSLLFHVLFLSADFVPTNIHSWCGFVSYLRSSSSRVEETQAENWSIQKRQGEKTVATKGQLVGQKKQFTFNSNQIYVYFFCLNFLLMTVFIYFLFSRNINS